MKYFSLRPKFWSVSFLSLNIQGHLIGVIRCIFPKIGHNSKMAYRRTKWTKIWPRGVYVAFMLVFLTLNMLGHFGSFLALFQKLARNSKTGHRRAKRMKIWASGVSVTCMLVFFTLNMSISFGVIWRSFLKNWPVSQK